MTYQTHKETRRGHIIRILSDDDPLNPFTDQDGLPDIVTWLRSYDFTTDRNTAGDDPESFLEKAKAGGYVFRPLRAYIHSGIAFSLTASGQFSDKWDSGFAGFIYWTPEKRESLGLTDSYIESILHEGETVESWHDSQFESAVEALNDYASGNVWGFEVTDKEGREVESVWGFFGDYDREGGALEEARGIADHAATVEREEVRDSLSLIAADYANLLECFNANKDTMPAPILRAVNEKLARLKNEESEKAARLAELESD